MFVVVAGDTKWDAVLDKFRNAVDNPASTGGAVSAFRLPAFPLLLSPVGGACHQAGRCVLQRTGDGHIPLRENPQ
jgi:hypothetical protein